MNLRGVRHTRRNRLLKLLGLHANHKSSVHFKYALPKLDLTVEPLIKFMLKSSVKCGFAYIWKKSKYTGMIWGSLSEKKRTILWEIYFFKIWEWIPVIVSYKKCIIMGENILIILKLLGKIKDSWFAY